MRYSKAKALKEGEEVILKRTGISFKVSYIDLVQNPDNDENHCWIHPTEKNESGCNVFHHKELK